MFSDDVAVLKSYFSVVIVHHHARTQKVLSKGGGGGPTQKTLCFCFYEGRQDQK